MPEGWLRCDIALKLGAERIAVERSLLRYSRGVPVLEDGPGEAGMPDSVFCEPSSAVAPPTRHIEATLSASSIRHHCKAIGSHLLLHSG